MKKLAFALVAIVTMAFASGAALAQGQGAHVGAPHGGGWHGGGWHGGGWHGPRVGVFVGYPGYWGAWPYPYFYPYSAYYPYSVYAPAEPAVYVQPAPDLAPTLPALTSPAPTSTNYWYYCTDPAGYFPYVQSCSKAWMQVVPQRGPNAPNVMPAP